MHSFYYRDQRLHCEGVELERVAAQFGTPLYVYSASTITDHYRRLDHALHDLDHRICYAVKANSNGAILRLLADAGAGFDIVSGGELFRVLAAGAHARSCTFAGVGKSREEIAYALKEGVQSFNVESESELELIDCVAREMQVRAPIALRVNPEVAAGTHKYVSTGTSADKFGVVLDRVLALYERASAMRNLALVGVQMHLGSQITATQPFADAIAKLTPLVLQLKRQHQIEFFSVGGGMGIVYESAFASGAGRWWKESETDGSVHALTIDDYAAAIVPPLRALGLRIVLEPGRILVGNAGVLLTRVRYLKRSQAKTFAIVDAGMNDLIRPALYQSYHEIVPLREPIVASQERVDVVGPVCESGDFFARDRTMPALSEGDLLAIMSAGAYGFVMASNYNSRPLPAEVLVRGDEFALIRERETSADLIRGERAPAFRS